MLSFLDQGFPHFGLFFDKDENTNKLTFTLKSVIGLPIKELIQEVIEPSCQIVFIALTHM